MGEYAGLILACLTFVGSHFAMSHPLRAPMVRILGEKGFLGVYSLISLAAIIWMVVAFRRAPSDLPLWGAGDGLWIIASILTLLAAVLYAGSMSGNPALPAPGAEVLASKEPHGVFRVTRHPMMWSFALWGIAHMLVASRPDSLIFVGSIVFLALFGAWAQQTKKRATMGDAWLGWQARTSYWPRLDRLAGVGLLPWIAGFAIWLAATWAHDFFGSYGAGLFRWLGN